MWYFISMLHPTILDKRESFYERKKITKLVLLSLLGLCLVFALYIMVKGLFKDPANFIQLAKNKITAMYHDVTNTEPAIQEEVITTADGHKVLLDRPKGYSPPSPTTCTLTFYQSGAN